MYEGLVNNVISAYGEQIEIRRYETTTTNLYRQGVKEYSDPVEVSGIVSYDQDEEVARLIQNKDVTAVVAIPSEDLDLAYADGIKAVDNADIVVIDGSEWRIAETRRTGRLFGISNVLLLGLAEPLQQ